MPHMNKTIAGLSVVLNGFLLLATGCSDIKAGSAWSPESAARPAIGPHYAWASEANPHINDIEGLQAPLSDLFRATVEQAYMKKGYRRGPVAQADFLVRGKVVAETRGDAYSPNAFGQFTEGTLMVYMVDPQREQWIWCGWATARLHESNTPQVKQERLNKAVQMILKNLPDPSQPARR